MLPKRKIANYDRYYIFMEIYINARINDFTDLDVFLWRSCRKELSTK